MQKLAVRIGGKRIEAEVEDSDEEWEEDDEAASEEYEEEDDPLAAEEDDFEEEEYEEEEEPAKPVAAAATGLRKLMGKAKPALRVRKGPEKDAREEVIEQLNEASMQEDTREYQLPNRRPADRR